MRITMFSHGTRGDIWPLVSLGSALQLRDHEVTFAVQDEYRPLAESAGLRTAPRDCAPTANAYRVKLGLAESSTSTFNRLQTGTALGLHTISPQLFPRPTDWPEHLKMTGAWRMPEAIRSAAGEQLDQELLDWLDAGAAPVFLGFGSMPVLEPQTMLDDWLVTAEPPPLPGGAPGARIGRARASVAA